MKPLLPLILLTASCHSPPRLPPRKYFPTDPNTLGMRMVSLPGGEFRMGNAEFRKPVHPVRVSPFAIGATEVTNRQYDALVKGRNRPAESRGDDMPATGVTHLEALRFAELLSKREGERYRLPTDAEWEYAARGGLEGKDYPWGDDASTIPANSGIHGPQAGAKPVGSYPPNAYGLYDMVGNASEWVLDTDFDLPPGVAGAVETDPIHRGGGALRLLRGGSFLTWYPFVWSVSPAVESSTPDELSDVGFRLVLEMKR